MSEEKKRFGLFKPFRFITGKIRNKLLVILLGVIFGNLWVAGIALVSMKSARDTLTSLIENESRVVLLAHKAEENILSARAQSQDYLLYVIRMGFENAREEYLSRVDQFLEDANKQLEEIKTLQTGTNVTDEILGVLVKNTASFEKAFVEVVKLKEIKGHRDVGLVGEMRKSIQSVENLIYGYPLLEVQKLTISRHEKDYLLRGDRKYAQAILENASLLQDEIRISSMSPANKEQAVASVEKYINSFDKMIAIDRQIADNSRVYRSSVSILVSNLGTMIEAQEAEQTEVATQMEAQEKQALLIIAVVSAVTLVLGLFSALFFSRRLTKQLDNIMDLFGSIGIGDFSARAEVLTEDELGEMAESLNAMLDNTLNLIQSRDERDAIQSSIMNLLMEISDLAEGDLTVRAEVTEEITGALADSFNSMAEQLSQVVVDVKKASALVGSTSEDVDQVTTRLAERSDEQANKIKEAITTIDDMATKIREVSQSAKESADVSDKALTSAREGSEAVRKTNDAMASIKDNMRGTASTIKRLGESSQEIGNIVQIINDIADRTSILALNASIQASMAGDAGRGFAVVAEEVQRLAERSAESTYQIETLINAIQGDISAAGTSMETSIQYVVEGTDLADEAHGRLDEIESVSNQLAEIIASISASAQEQSIESENVTNMMQEVGVLTAETTDASKETAASMEKITSTSKQLEESISVFKVAGN